MDPVAQRTFVRWPRPFRARERRILSLSHSRDSEFTGVQSWFPLFIPAVVVVVVVDSPCSRLQPSWTHREQTTSTSFTGRLPSNTPHSRAVHSQTRQTEPFPSRRNRSHSTCFSAHVGPLPFRCRRHPREQPPLHEHEGHEMTPCPPSYFSRNHSSAVNRRDTSAALTCKGPIIAKCTGIPPPSYCLGLLWFPRQSRGYRLRELIARDRSRAL